VPILLQVYFNSGLTYGLMRFFKVASRVAAPGALIGASNFFELAVATAIASMDRVRAPREHSDLAVDHGRFGVIADPLRMVAK
jgi:hypothetical protein